MKREVEVEERLCDIKDQLDTLMIEKEGIMAADTLSL
jgi:hypothetical protein